MSNAIEDSLVAVFSARNGQETFEGSAFFITPRHLLTAKHVVYDVQKKMVKSHTYLRLVHGHTKWNLSQDNFEFHESKDVALLTLAHPVSGQQHGDLANIQAGHQGLAVSIWGVDKGSEARAPMKSHTLTTYDSDIHMYKLDHQVLGGYSGGLVAAGESLIGIVIQRHKEDQFSLALPLYELKEWVKSRIGSTVKHACRSGEEYVYQLRVFIDRPKRTYQVILDALDSQPVSGFVCVTVAYDHHEPREFGRTLAMRVSARNVENPYETLFDELKIDRLAAPSLGIDFREIDSESQFHSKLLSAIYEELSGVQSRGSGEMTDKDKRIAIIQRMQASPIPRIFLMYKNLTSVGMLQKLRGQSASRQIQRFAKWISSWNEQWSIHSMDEPMQPLVVLLMVDVDVQTAEQYRSQQKEELEIKKSLPLTRVEREDFNQWLVHAKQFLKLPSVGMDSDIDRVVEKAEKKLLEGLDEAKGEDFPLYYRRFSQVCKTLISERE